MGQINSKIVFFKLVDIRQPLHIFLNEDCNELCLQYGQALCPNKVLLKPAIFFRLGLALPYDFISLWNDERGFVHQIVLIKNDGRYLFSLKHLPKSQFGHIGSPGLPRAHSKYVEIPKFQAYPMVQPSPCQTLIIFL